MAVLVTLLALVLAGLVGGSGARTGGGSAAVAVARTFACPGGLPGTRATGGGARSGGARTTQVAAAPRIVSVGATSAAQGYAFEESRPGGALAATPCPEPRAQWWFTGLGASGPHTSRVLLTNPRQADAFVDVQVLGPGGPVDVPGLRGLAVRHGQTRVLDLARVTPSRGDLAVHVSASRGLVSAVAADSYATGILGRPMQEWVPGGAAPARHALVTALPDKPDTAQLVLANPGQVETLTTLRVAGPRGTFTLPGHEEVRVPPGGTTSVDVGKAFDGHPTALRVDAEHPVAASVRTMSRGDIAYSVSGQPLRRLSALGVPAGVPAQVRLTSTGETARVRVLGYDARGHETGAHRVTIRAGSTRGLGVAPGTRAVVVEPGGGPVVAGLVLGTDGGIAAMTFPPAGTASRAPVVRPE